MKRIGEYRKLFGAEESSDLKQLKATYRNLVKEWHPDKFPGGGEKAKEAEGMSRKIIDAYHFLVSIAPETKLATVDAYTEAIESGILDLLHKGLLLEINFVDGSTYEFFGVDKKLFTKLLNADKQTRFAKRKIYNTFLYRKSKKSLEA